MSTSVYGDRDFKGNIVSNAAMPFVNGIANLPVAGSVPFNTHYGHPIWVKDQHKPYWWDADTQTWKTIEAGGGGDYYGVKSSLPPTVYNNPITSANDTATETWTTLIHPSGSSSHPNFDDFAEITVSRPLWINFQAYMGFCRATVTNTGQAPEYNRVGTCDTWILVTAKPSSGTTEQAITASVSVYTHGWSQAADTIADTRLGADVFSQGTVNPNNIQVPAFPVGSSDGTAGNFTQSSIDWVDLHTTWIDNNSLNFRGLALTPILPCFLWRPYLKQSGDKSGLIFHCKTFGSGEPHTYLGYKWGASTAQTFVGGPVGPSLTYWF